MKNFNFRLVPFLFLCWITQGFGQPSSDPVHKTLFVIVDGISEDVIRSTETPHLDEIAESGAFLPAYVGGEKGTYSETPTISAVGYNSLLTGTWVHKHNVRDNEIEHPNYNYYTIFRFFKEQYPAGKTAIFSTWLDNRIKLVGTGLNATNNLQMDYHFDGFEHDHLAFPHDQETTYIRDIDDFVSAEAARYIASESPDLSWVYLQFTDNMGHMYGDHPKFHESIRHMDRQIGEIWAAIREREKITREKWLLVITTDHGRSADSGKGHGGQSDRERNTWIVTNRKDLNEYAKNERVGIVDIFPTIADFMKISIPLHRKREIDGISLIKKIDAAHLHARKSENQLDLRWKAYAPEGKARIWIARTNQFKYGGEDQYYFLGEVDISEEKKMFSLENLPAEFYKVVLETSAQSLNTWIVEE